MALDCNFITTLASERKPIRILICTTPGVGHINPILAFVNQIAIAAHGNATITLVSSEVQIANIRKVREVSGGLGTYPGGLDIHLVGVFDGYPMSTNRAPVPAGAVVWDLQQKMEREMERYLECLASHGESPTCILTDMHLWYTQKVADRLKIPRYIFFSTSAFYVALMWYVPQLVSEGLLELGPTLSNSKDGLRMSGFPDLPRDKFPNSARERPQTFLSCADCLSEAKGILINTFTALESDGISALQAGSLHVAATKFRKVPRLFPVGPLLCPGLVNELISAKEVNSCIQFLDDKPPSSVVYVALGTEAAIARAEVYELAIGLEASGQHFIWVLRTPSSPSSSEREIIDSLALLLPQGFQERTSGRGLVVANLAPQLRVLSHPSTGLFLTHCGWNSLMETIYFGIPVLAFPQGADQRMNCRFVVDTLKIGIELPRQEHQQEAGLQLASKEVERRIRLMLAEGEEFRDRVIELQKLAVLADASKSGSAFQNLQMFLDDISS